MNRVLITGGGGFVGSRVLRRLLARGCECVALLRPGASRSRLPEPAAGLSVIEADFHSPAAMATIMAAHRPDTLIHLAWGIEQGAYLEATSNLLDLSASLSLFQTARAHGCHRITGVGTCLEYDATPGVLNEQSPLLPRSTFAASKAALYLAASAWATSHGVSFAWARPFYIYGPAEHEQRLVAAVATALLRGETVATTAGEQRRDYLHVDDVADAIATLAVGSVEGPMNVGSGEAIRIRDLVEQLAATLGRPELVEFGRRPTNPSDPPLICADVSRLGTTLGWRPSISLTQGLASTVEWWARVPADEEPRARAGYAVPCPA